ncbi:MAG TPA: Asp-tRNA(Asn)/Glu-tRNA(Gln) amidotransferase subunit GatC [Candidatus Gracilibacteria bacterium]
MSQTFSQDEIKKIATLAKLKLTSEEETKYAAQLSGVLDFFSQLQEVDTQSVAETSQVTGLENVMQEDVVENESPEKMNLLLNCSSHPIEDNSIKIPKIM